MESAIGLVAGSFHSEKACQKTNYMLSAGFQTKTWLLRGSSLFYGLWPHNNATRHASDRLLHHFRESTCLLGRLYLSLGIRIELV